MQEGEVYHKFGAGHICAPSHVNLEKEGNSACEKKTSKAKIHALKSWRQRTKMSFMQGLLPTTKIIPALDLFVLFPWYGLDGNFVPVPCFCTQMLNSSETRAHATPVCGNAQREFFQLQFRRVYLCLVSRDEIFGVVPLVFVFCQCPSLFMKAFCIKNRLTWGLEVHAHNRAIPLHQK